MMKSKIMKYIVLIFTTLLLLTACGGDGKNGAASDYNLLDETPAVTLVSIQVTPAKITVPKGTTGEYTALAYYSDESSKDVSSIVAWTSTDTGVVAFNSSVHNHAEALSVGKSKITATLDGIVSNVATVDVISAVLNHIRLDPIIKTVAKGVYVQYHAIGYYDDDNSTFYDLTPLAKFSSSLTSVAVVQSGGSIPGLAQTKQEGQTYITASFDGKTSNTAELNVTAAKLSLIHIEPQVVDVPKGTTGSYVATAYYEDGSHYDITKQATWKSADTNIVSIISSGDNAGYAEALNVGNTTITATFDEKTSNVATVTVRDAILKSIHITPEVTSVPEGVKVDYIAVGTYSDGTTHDISNSAVWRSSDTDIATVISTDISKATFDTHGIGKALITVNVGSITSNEAELTVTPKEVFSLLITPAQDQTMNVGTQTQLTVTATYTTGFSKDVTHDAAWDSSDASVASVESGTNGGLVTANSPGGPVDITAVFEGITSNIKKITVVDDGPKAIASYDSCDDSGDAIYHTLIGSNSTPTDGSLDYKWTIEADGSLDDADRAYIDDTVANPILTVTKGAPGIEVSKIVAKLTVTNSAGTSSALVIPYFSAECP